MTFEEVIFQLDDGKNANDFEYLDKNNEWVILKGDGTLKFKDLVDTKFRHRLDPDYGNSFDNIGCMQKFTE